jgi:hypothetical protein
MCQGGTVTPLLRDRSIDIIEAVGVIEERPEPRGDSQRTSVILAPDPHDDRRHGEHVIKKPDRSAKRDPVVGASNQFEESTPHTSILTASISPQSSS